MCLRAKFRGSLKALITKDKMETSYPAQLITEGIVTSLKIIVIGMGDRGSKSIIGYIPIPQGSLVKKEDLEGNSCKRATSRWFFSIKA